MDQVKIGKFIRKLRKEKNMTQEDLAEKLGVTDRSVSNWENGKNMPDVSLYKLLCNELGISVNELISGEKIKEENYKEKSDNNILTAISKIEKEKKKRKRVLIVILIVFLLLASYIIYGNIMLIETNIKYDDRVMKCNYNTDTKEFSYLIYGTTVANMYTVERKLDNKNIIFIKAKLSLGNRRYYHWENYHDMANLINGDKNIFREELIFDSSDSGTEIYYTQEKIDRIKKASDKELEKIVKKSNFMCSN